MGEHREERRQALEEAGHRALDRRDRDGLAGAGDMLGGLSTGAGGRLGADDVVATVPEPGPVSEREHDGARAEPQAAGVVTVQPDVTFSMEGV